ncbi:hypothetical protein AVEN_235365-1 [Araneus ventricosus]|uniref:Uncharacterized protein n=1 Tax=Araneus ventricosus TaxID=182803 RepID=A0A4Y2A586_ARAVE|nr:hypothetical protein AVEN_235365-1 [Araneus ventricosus]
MKQSGTLIQNRQFFVTSQSWYTVRAAPAFLRHWAKDADAEVRLQSKMSSSQIKDEMQFPCTNRTIRNTLHRNTNVVYKKLKGKPSRSKRRIDSCLNFEWKPLTAGTDWNDVVFSNEKSFI